MKPLLNKNGVDLIYKEPDMDIIVHADKDLLKQVFINLTINSFQAMSNGGILKVKIDLCLESINNENWVEICFEDNGPGMDSVILNKIFNPFYTTREKGTGLGLAIVHNIIEGHNGLIEARSEKGRGACFQISLPAQMPN
jgi:two-component system sensor histidine kinase FlrB